VENLQLFTRLFSKYLDNRCSPEEIDYLLGLMQSEEYKSLANEMIESRLQKKTENTDQVLWERLDIRLRSILADSSEPAIVKHHWFYVWRWVAAASVLIIVSLGLYRLSIKNAPAGIEPVGNTSLRAAALSSYTRYITLPDGSSVVLHAGSKLEYPVSFTGDTREVRLSGEAYFDVAHNSAKPFIIYTGKVKTTVLGTAFNIKSDEKRVTVSVTRGKVKVEDGSKILAVLTPDQQVQYNVPEAISEQHTVNASSIVTHWTKENMVFNGISFEEIADILSKRYNVPVQFKNESLKRCKIRASFSGTEALEQVAGVLSAIRNGSFEQLADGAIVFSGDGCD